jgi:hypothetical protein
MSQATSKTAIIATIAAELRGVPADAQPSWFRSELDVEIGEKGRKIALRQRKQLSRLDEKKGRKSDDASTTHESDEWIWDTIGVDLHKLDLERAFVVFEPLKETEALVRHLRATIGVAEILETYGDGTDRRVLARVVFWGAQRRAQIDDQMRRAGVRFEWWDIRRESPSQPFEEAPAAKTWAALARQIGVLEGHTIHDHP